MATAKGRDAGIPPEPVLRRLRVPMIRRGVLANRGHSEEVFVIDVGLLGIFVEHKQPLAIGERVEIEFGVPGNELPVRASCRVAWYHERGKALQSKVLPTGLGLEFIDLAQADDARIRDHVVAYCRRHPKTRQFHPSWPEDELAGRRSPAE
jgi:hypothetical protein